MMRSEHTAIILGKLALLEYRDLKTAMKYELKSVRKNGVILLKFGLSVQSFSAMVPWRLWHVQKIYCTREMSQSAVLELDAVSFLSKMLNL